MDTSNKIERIQNPRANANILEVLTFSWMFNLFKTGRKRDLGINDLYEALNDHKATLLGNELERKWELELADAHKKNKNPSLLKVLLQLFGTKIMICGFLLFLSDIILKVFQTLMLGGLLTYFNPEMTNKTDLKHAYIYASGLLISMLVSMVLFHNTLTQMAHFGMKIRVACCSLIFRKALRLSQKVYSEITVGHIVNLLSNDVNRFDLASPFLHHLWIGPLHTIVATYFIWQEIGASSLLGVATLILFIPLQGWLGKKTSEYRHRIAINTDERVRLVKEIILGIQVIKFYTWEKPFAYLVQCARKKEINLIRGTSVIRAVLVSFIVFNTKIALFISILLYVILGNYITAQKVFIVTSYYNQLRITMSSFFPRGIGYTAEVMITIKRIQNFLIYEEKDDKIANISRVDKITTDNHNSNNKLTSICNDNIHLKNYRVIISDATAKWTNHQTDNSLANINLCIKPGQLVAIIGPVGAGKSSLIQAILRELPLTRGTISVNGTVSYASQEPWLFSGTIQQNILFGLPMNRKRYEKVLRVCALNGDIKQFPNFDETIVGERGLSLSGGQRARINLARAIYKKADIYILDDPLSAVDTRVGSHLFEKCIKDYLKYSTCILITHQTQYLTNVDQIVLMENANVLAQGTYEELQASNLDFTKLLQSLVVPHNGCNTINESEFNLEPKIIHEPQLSIQNIESPVDEFKTKHILTTSIHRTQNHSSGQNLYLTYLKAGGTLCKISFFIFICVFTQVLISAESIWITYWVNLEENEFCKVKDTCVSNKKTTNDDHSLKIFLWWSISRQTCIIVYTIIICIILLITAIRSATFVSVCMSVSMNLHNRLLNAIIRGTMFFFHTNSSGYILDRFSKDMGVVDEILPISLMDSIHYGLSLVGIIIVVGIVNIYLMIPIFFLAIIFYKITIFYLTTSRNIRRLEGITRSSIFAHMNAALQGLTTIRAFKAEQILYNEFDKYQDVHSSAWYIFISSSRAFGFWLDLVCLVYISIVTFSFIVFDNDTFGGNVGLAITQVYSMANMLQWGLRQIAELENNMISVERLVEFTNCPQEYHTESLPDKKPSSNWPMNGQITFKNFCLRYSSNAPYVIKNLNISVESMQKVGVVGRTGAGKSSLIGALFRLALNEGNIIIDGIEIHELGLHDLRSKLSIIPQEPVLFTGTMRTNLDPFGEYPDHVLWNALDDVELKDVVEELPDGLNSKMSEGGGNFSVGQRQLVCLARAIIRNNKILVLDEVTANVDPQTDALIQNTIRNKFRTCTVITIAHRLNTVMDSDKVLVMDAGAAVEFDHPYNLLQNKNGHLYKLVEQTGRANADLLHGVAEENYKSTKMSESSTYR